MLDERDGVAVDDGLHAHLMQRMRGNALLAVGDHGGGLAGSRARSVADGRRGGLEDEPPWRRDVGERLGRRVCQRDGIAGHGGAATALEERDACVAVQARRETDRAGTPGRTGRRRSSA